MSKLPPGRILHDKWAPFLVMEDGLGFFVLTDRIRNYCADQAAAIQMAQTLSRGIRFDAPASQS